jgi:hypothetical protein
MRLKFLFWPIWEKKSRCLSKSYAQNKLTINNAMITNALSESWIAKINCINTNANA